MCKGNAAINIDVKQGAAVVIQFKLKDAADGTYYPLSETYRVEMDCRVNGGGALLFRADSADGETVEFDEQDGTLIIVTVPAGTNPQSADFDVLVTPPDGNAFYAFGGTINIQRGITKTQALP